MVQTQLASLDIDTLPLMLALQRAISNAAQLEQNGYFSSLVDRLTDCHHCGTPTIAEFTTMITGLCCWYTRFQQTPYQQALSTHLHAILAKHHTLLTNATVIYTNTPYQHILSRYCLIITLLTNPTEYNIYTNTPSHYITKLLQGYIV